MNRRQKIIVSVTGIFIVLLLLVGLTYAYFLTQITGNNKDKSISVSTANLALVYGDGNGIISGENIQPGKTLNEKTFTVKNAGNVETDYVVVIEDVKITYAENVNEQVAGESTTFESNDFIYTLTCTSDGEACNGVDIETTFPITNGILVGNSVEVGKTHTYSLIITYKETGIDQSNDMNKTLEATVNIADIKNINPYNSNKDSLSYKIINSATTEINKTKLMTKPKTSIQENADAGVQYKYIQDNIAGSMDINSTYYYEEMEFNEYTGMTTLKGRKEATSNEDCVENYVDFCNCGTKDPCDCADSVYVKSVDGDRFSFVSLWPELSEVQELENNEKVLSITQDDFGTSYYYRGRVLDNYVNYANKCWRIVRILGNGNIKLVLDDNNALCNSDDYSGEHSIGNSMVGTKYNEKIGITIPSYMDLTNETSTLLMYKNFQTNQGSFSTSGVKDYTSVLTNIGWCIEETPYTYEGVKIEDLTDAEYKEWVNGETYDGTFVPGIFFPSYFRRQNNLYSLRCSGYYAEKYDATTDMLVGGLTMDEVIFSGIINYTHPDISNSSYLMNKYESEWGYNSYYEFNTMSLGSNLYYQKEYRASNVDGVYPSEGSVRTRPAVVLKSNINVTGTGTRLDPYEIVFD